MRRIILQLRKFSVQAIVIAATAIVLNGDWPISLSTSSAATTGAQLRDAATQELQQALKNGPQWVNVHAAEALLSLGIDNNAAVIFEEELKQHGDEPGYRIGIRRVLFRASHDPVKRSQYLEAIRSVYLDLAATDRGHAAETLAKLRYSIPSEDRPKFRKFAEDSTDANAPYRRWILANSGDAKDARFLAELLDSPKAEIRANTAYAIRFLAPKLPRDVVEKLAAVAEAEPPSLQRVYLISAAYVTAPDADRKTQFKKQLLQYVHSGKTDEKCEAASALAIRGTGADLPQLTELLHDSEADVRVSAASTILHMDPPRSLLRSLE